MFYFLFYFFVVVVQFSKFFCFFFHFFLFVFLFFFVCFVFFFDICENGKHLTWDPNGGGYHLFGCSFLIWTSFSPVRVGLVIDEGKRGLLSRHVFHVPGALHLQSHQHLNLNANEEEEGRERER